MPRRRCVRPRCTRRGYFASLGGGRGGSFGFDVGSDVVAVFGIGSALASDENAIDEAFASSLDAANIGP